MPRNMSFMLTTDQFINQTKTVTRRNGWLFLKVGDILTGVEKSQGLKRGEQINRLGQIKVVSIDREPISAITKSDCIAEGFPEMKPSDFVDFYCKHNKISADDLVTRIEFEYIE